MKSPCPFCGKMKVFPQSETQFICPCGAYGSLHLREDAYLFANEAAEALGLKPTEWIDGGGYIVADNPNRFMELRDAGTVFIDNDEDEYALQWAKRREPALPAEVSVLEFVKLYAARWGQLKNGKWKPYPKPTASTVGLWAKNKRGGIEWGRMLHNRMWLINVSAMDAPPPAKGRPKVQK